MYKETVTSLLQTCDVAVGGSWKDIILIRQTNKTNTFVKCSRSCELDQSNVVIKSWVVVAWMRDDFDGFNFLFCTLVDVTVVVSKTNGVQCWIATYNNETTNCEMKNI